MRRAVFLLAAAAVALAAFILWPRPQAAGPRALILVTIDTLRADRLDSRVMPRLAALAGTGRRFTHARTPVPLTLPAHASLMTGLLPPEHGTRENGVPLAAGHPALAESLRAAGFRTAAFVSAYVLDRQFGVAAGFETYDDAIARDPDAPARLEAERSGAATVDAALAWLKGIDLSRERAFMWIHLFEPHAPYPAGYDADVAKADAQIGRLLDAVTASHASPVAWIIAGDHGEALGSHGETTHGMLVYDATLRVPLVLHGPGIPASVDDAPVSLTDIAPTALRWMGLTPPASMRGVDLRDPVETDRDVYSESMYPRAAGWHGLTALSGPRWKVIRSSETELYDIPNDPQEERNVAGAHAPAAAAMREAAGAIASAASGPKPNVSAEARERLRALGYVSGSSAVTDDAAGAPNPAREITAWVRFERALTLVTAGRAHEARADLAALAAAYPRAHVFQTIHARALTATGDHAGALRVLRAVVAARPDDATAFHDLAAAARLAGDAAEAARAEHAALALDPGNAAALNGLGLLHADAGRPADAARAFEQAAARDPGNASYWTNLGNARRALGNTAGAGEAYRRALERAPDHVDALNGMGALLVQAGRPVDAIPLFQRAVAGDATHIEARLNLGIAFQESGRLPDAAAAYREVLARAKPGSREHGAAKRLLGTIK